MRQTISGLIAAIAVLAASSAPAMACYGPCAQPQVYVSPAPTYGYSGCNTGCGGWAHERLPDPMHQYYYVNQGPTYTGPGNWAPLPTYQENAIPSYRAHRYHRHWRARTSYYHAPRHSHAPRYYGQREGVLRRYD